MSPPWVLPNEKKNTDFPVVTRTFPGVNGDNRIVEDVSRHERRTTKKSLADLSIHALRESEWLKKIRCVSVKWSYGLLPSGLGVHTIPVPMELKTLVGPAPVGAPTGAKVIFFCLRRANKVMLRLGVAIDNSTLGMPIHGYRLTRHTATIRQGSSF